MHKLTHQYKAFFDTPLLVKHPADFIEHITAFDFKPDHYNLEQDFKVNQKFIGKRVELFLDYALAQSTSYEVISHSLQIFNQKQTLGEFDYLIRDLATAEVFQLELVYKVYLFDEHLSSIPDFCWIGPNRRDRFQDKITKLKCQQFPLIYHEQSKHQLKTLGIDLKSLQQKLCFKALLFKPFQANLPKFNYLTDISIEGEWLSRPQFYASSWHNFKFILPEKLDWFNALESIKEEQWQVFEAIEEPLNHYLKSGRSPLIWVRDMEQRRSRKLFIANW